MEKCYFHSCPLNDKFYLEKFKNNFNFNQISDKNLTKHIKSK